MSVLRPEDVAVARIEALIAQVQKAIVGDYSPGGVVNLTIKRSFPEQTLVFVVNEFRAAGWNVSIIDRNGYSLSGLQRWFCLSDTDKNPRPKQTTHTNRVGEEDTVIL